MKNDRSSLVSWVIVVGLIFASALLSALWPSIRAELAGDAEVEEEVVAAPPVEEEPIRLDFIPLEPFQELAIPPLLAMLILAALIIGPIIVMGAGLAFAFNYLARQTEETKEDREFQERLAALEKSEQERIRELRQKQPARPVPDHDRPGWSMASTIMVLTIFAIFLGTAIADTFVPGGVIERGGELLNVNAWVALTLAALVAVISLVLLRPRTIKEAETADNMPIPWDTIWVVISGVIMLGMGIGVMVVLMR